MSRALVSKIDETAARVGKRAADEDITLKDGAKTLNGEDWAAISSMVPGRTKTECKSRWQDSLRSKTDETAASVGKNGQQMKTSC
jgi:hypothetical protein